MKPLLCLITIAAAWLALGGCSTSPHQENKMDSYLDDKVTADRVENSLHHLEGGRFNDLHAASTNGVVYLTGAVGTLELRQMADELARKIDGVKLVHNDISIR